MSTTGIACLSALGLSITKIMKQPLEDSDTESEDSLFSEKKEVPA
jgi:hypothetical protein